MPVVLTVSTVARQHSSGGAYCRQLRLEALTIAYHAAAA